MALVVFVLIFMLLLSLPLFHVSTTTRLSESTSYEILTSFMN